MQVLQEVLQVLEEKIDLYAGVKVVQSALHYMEKLRSDSEFQAI